MRSLTTYANKFIVSLSCAFYAVFSWQKWALTFVIRPLVHKAMYIMFSMYSIKFQTRDTVTG